MKLIGPPGTELRHILAIYIMCLCDLDLWPTFPKIGSRDPELLLNVDAYLEIYRLLVFDRLDHKLQIYWPRCEATVVAMATILRLTRWGSSSCWLPRMKFMWPPVMELWHILP